MKHRYNMAKRPITPTYITFYLLFLPDFWQILMGIFASWIIGPRIMPADDSPTARILLYVMLGVVGYTASRPLGRGITKLLKKTILGKRA